MPAQSQAQRKLFTIAEHHPSELMADKKEFVMSLRCEARLIKKIDRMCKSLGMSRAAYIRFLLMRAAKV